MYLIYLSDQKDILILVYVSEPCISYAPRAYRSQWSQEEGNGPLELELQWFVGNHNRAGKSNLGPPQEYQVSSTTDPSISSAPS